MNRPPCVTGEIYHIYNRGVDKRVVYTTDDDRRYFIHLLYSLNDTVSVENTQRTFSQLRSSAQNKGDEGGSTSFISRSTKRERERLVDILAFVLMPNHYHLLLRQRVDDGISKFMQKIGTGYTMLFNEKYGRSGSLFQGRFKSIPIMSQQQLLYIFHYIHLNPVTLIPHDQQTNLARETFLERYRWSSYPDYVGIKNVPSILTQDVLRELFGGTGGYKKDILPFLHRDHSFDLFDQKLLIDSDSRTEGG